MKGGPAGKPVPSRGQVRDEEGPIQGTISINEQKS